MIVAIQSVPERIENVLILKKEFPDAYVHEDVAHTGSLHSFQVMLRTIPHTGFRLHLQDDVELANGLRGYLPKIVSDMHEAKMHLVSLFVPRRKSFRNMPPDVRYYPFKNFLWLQGCIFSPDLQTLLINHRAKSLDAMRHDDCFVAECLKENGIEAFVHNPGLVQHRLDLPSAMGHGKGFMKDRRSECFSKNFIQ